ncbi:MAG: flagellar motor switch protein FliM [Phycisphaeraceae bacterium]|nr:flagellar motor switch protein FliM [Phycisphaerae bacterium]MBX3392381.1 flagellar motor switch protein FliM [Phycisphaeraceae bacterium]HRJ49967.1 flagellar motor switch protein FliM [Phycisphaerales bacterium]
MSNKPSQSESDAILASPDPPGDEAATSPTRIFSRSVRDPVSTEVRAYDFKRPERVSKDQMRSLQTLHEGFARNFGASLSGFLRTIVEVRLATCEQMTYSEFISALPNPTSFNLLHAEGLEGQMCLEVSPLIIYPIIDRLLGGTSHDLFIPQRPMTLIESRLISNITNRGLAALSEAWASVRQLSFSVAATESNPQLVQIVPPNEVVVVLGFELKITNRAGTMNLCIPYNVIEPVIESLSSQSWFAASRNQRSKAVEETIGKSLKEAGLVVTGILARTTITLSDVLRMQPGDIIVTEKPATEPVVVCVEGEPKFHAHLGQHKSARALRITSPVMADDQANR